MNGTLTVTQLFGGNPAREAYTSADGYRVLGHTGIDLSCPVGTPLYPCWDGVVHIADSGEHGFGLHATITDAAGRQALYGHLSAILVKEGDAVRVHGVFAHSGNTGYSTGPHLHFEIHEAHADPANGYNGARDPLGGFDHDVIDRFDLSPTNL